MSLPEIIILFFQFTHIIIKTIDLFDHPHFTIALQIKVFLNLPILFIDTIVQYSYFIFIVSLNLINLNSS